MTNLADHLSLLTELNLQYIRSSRDCDTEWFAQNTGEDFTYTGPDGRYLDQAGFLAMTAAAAKRPVLDVDEVEIRIIGEVALIHARTTFVLAGGETGNARYTDIYARRDGRWVAIAAQITRIQQGGPISQPTLRRRGGTT